MVLLMNDFRKKIYKSKKCNKFILTINNNYNNYKEIYIVEVLIKKDFDPEKEVILGTTPKSKNKYYVANIDSLKVMLNLELKQYKCMFQINAKESQECDKKILLFRIKEFKNNIIESTIQDTELIQRVLWSTEKIKLQNSKDKYISAKKMAYFNLGKNIGNELEKPRPCIVWKKKNCNSYIIPLTTKETKLKLSIQINNKDTYVKIDKLKMVSNKRLVNRINNILPEDDIEKINEEILNFYTINKKDNL